MPGAWDWSLVGVLRSNKPCAMAKKKEKEEKFAASHSLLHYFLILTSVIIIMTRILLNILGQNNAG